MAGRLITQLVSPGLKVKQVFDKHLVTFGSGRLAQLAAGSVVASDNDCVVLATACAGPQSRRSQEGRLLCDYVERASANGQIPLSSLRREVVPKEPDLLVAHFMERSLKPMLPEGFLGDIQVICTLLSFDEGSDVTSLCVNAGSLALKLADLADRNCSPVGCVRVGWLRGSSVEGLEYESFVPAREGAARLDGDYVMDTLVAGTQAGFHAMDVSTRIPIESRSIVNAVEHSQKSVHEIIELQNRLLEKWIPKNKEKLKAEWKTSDEILGAAQTYGAKRRRNNQPIEASKDEGGPSFSDEEILRRTTEALQQTESADLYFQALDDVRSEVLGSVLAQETDDEVNHLRGQNEESPSFAAVDEMLDRSTRINLAEGNRLGGRPSSESREPFMETFVLPEQVHGSVSFGMGRTHVLTTATLGGRQDAQKVERHCRESFRKHLMVHHEAPPFGLGRIGKMEISRESLSVGNFVEEALTPVVPRPHDDEFPYSMRVHIEPTSMEDSTVSVAVSSATLALLDAGVPLSDHVAGVTIGLGKHEEISSLLVDLVGLEEAYCAATCRIAGTAQDITAVQFDAADREVDVKEIQMMLSASSKPIQDLVEKMRVLIESPRSMDEKDIPLSKVVNFDPKQGSRLIGLRGAKVDAIETEHSVKLDVEPDLGRATIYGKSQLDIDAVSDRIERIVWEPVVGEIYVDLEVFDILRSAVVVRFPQGEGVEGVIRISDIAIRRLDTIEGTLKIGDRVKAKCMDVDSGSIKLSMKAVLLENQMKMPNAELFIGRGLPGVDEEFDNAWKDMVTPSHKEEEGEEEEENGEENRKRRLPKKRKRSAIIIRNEDMN